MAEGSQNGKKTLWEKEKLLVTSNFSFSHSVFKRLVQQTCKKKEGIVWERVKANNNSSYQYFQFVPKTKLVRFKGCLR